MSIKQIQKKEIVIHDFDKGLDHTLKAIEGLSERNSELIKKYNKERVRNSQVIIIHKLLIKVL